MSEASQKFSETWTEEAALDGKRVEESEAPAPEPEHLDLRESIERLEYFADEALTGVRLGRITMRDGHVVTVPKRLKRILYDTDGQAAGMYEEVGQAEAAAAVTGLPLDAMRSFLAEHDRDALERLEDLTESAGDEAEDADEEGDKVSRIIAELISKVKEEHEKVLAAYREALTVSKEGTARAHAGWETAARDLDEARAALREAHRQLDIYDDGEDAA